MVLILSYENEFNLHVKGISFSYEKMSTKTRFEEEAKSNSEMAYFSVSASQFHDSCIRAMRHFFGQESHCAPPSPTAEGSCTPKQPEIPYQASVS